MADLRRGCSQQRFLSLLAARLGQVSWLFPLKVDRTAPRLITKQLIKRSGHLLLLEPSIPLAIVSSPIIA